MENKKSKKIIIAVICAVLAVALVVAILAIFDYDIKKRAKRGFDDTRSD